MARKPKMIYKWAEGFPSRGKSAAAVGKRLMEIKEQVEREGRTARKAWIGAIVEDARHPKSMLHPFIFGCDVAEAARRYRYDQASRLIRAVHVTVIAETRSGGRREITVRSYPFIWGDTQEERRYEHIHVAMSDPRSRHYILQRALKELEIWQNKYNNYNELATIYAAIAKVKTQLSGNPKRRRPKRRDQGGNPS